MATKNKTSKIVDVLTEKSPWQKPFLFLASFFGLLFLCAAVSLTQAICAATAESNGWWLLILPIGILLGIAGTIVILKWRKRL